MKKIKGLKAVILLLTLTVVCCVSGFAQSKTMYVMKGDKVVFKTTVSVVDSVIFYNPASPMITPSQDALFIYKSLSTDEKLLDHVRKLLFSVDKLSVIERNNTSQQHNIDDITKLQFGGSTSGVDYPSQDRFDVRAYFSPEGNIVVESSSLIQSLTLFGIDGKIIASSASAETLHAASLPAGIYLIHVETQQGTVVKKLIKH